MSKILDFQVGAFLCTFVNEIYTFYTFFNIYVTCTISSLFNDQFVIILPVHQQEVNVELLPFHMYLPFYLIGTESLDLRLQVSVS